MKILGIALLATVSSVYIGIFLAADMALYCLWKVFQKDFRYWLRLDGVIAWVVSIIARFFIKILVDFTTNVQMRVSI